MDRHMRISEVAYKRWVERGCPEGSADEDWLAAERQSSEEHADVLESQDLPGEGAAFEVTQTHALADLSTAK